MSIDKYSVILRSVEYSRSSGTSVNKTLLEYLTADEFPGATFEYDLDYSIYFEFRSWVIPKGEVMAL